MGETERALVLGGGGVTGIAWELGLIAELAALGVPLPEASVVVGTSAGASVGAQLSSGAPVEELYAVQLRPATGEISASLNVVSMLRFVLASVSSRDEERARARLGRMALRHRGAAGVEERKAVIASRLPSSQWPTRQRLLITAVDAETGRLRVFDAGSGVDLIDAVAASCAVPLVWPPVPIGDRFYVDGGVRSPANADLAIGAGRVVVLAPIAQSVRPSGRVDRQLAALGPGVRTVVITPDEPARAAIGRNVLDPRHRAAAARAGRDQAARAVAAVRAVWD